MADETTPSCTCVKWHAPKPTRLGRLTVNGEVIHLCPASYTAVTDCVKLLTETGGKATTKQKGAFPKFARDLAQRVYAESITTAATAVTTATAEAREQADAEADAEAEAATASSE